MERAGAFLLCESINTVPPRHHQCPLLFRALHLAFPSYSLCLSAFPSFFLKLPCLCMKSAFEFIFYCLGLDPIPGGVRMGFFNTWEGGAAHCLAPCLGAYICGEWVVRGCSSARLVSPPTPAQRWLGSHLTVDYSLQVLRKWRIRAKIVEV